MAVMASGQITLTDLNDARSLQLRIDSNLNTYQLFDQNTQDYTPNWGSTALVLTPKLFVTGSASNIVTDATVTWKEDATTLSTTGIYTVNATNKTLTVAGNAMAAKTGARYTCSVSWYDTITGVNIDTEATIDFVKVSTGENSYTVILSNESHTVLADSAGTAKTNELGASGRAKSNVLVYKGAAALTGVTGVPTTGQFRIVAGTHSNATATITASAIQVDTLTADVGAVNVSIQLEGTTKTVSKSMSLSKVKDGAAGGTGAAATSYDLIVGASSINKSLAGGYTPTSIKLEALYQTGAAVPAAYSGQFKVYTSTNLNTASPTWTLNAGLSSSVNESTRTISITGLTMNGLKVELYLAGGTTLVDTQVIPVVNDGATGGTGPAGSSGANGVNLMVYGLDGTVIYNYTNSLRLQADLYDGATAVTSGATYQWYQQETNGSWTLITGTPTGLTNFTTKTMTVAPAAFQNVKTYKAVVTYNSKTYEGTITVMDKTDIYQVDVRGVSTFRNGTGSTTLKAHVFLNGVEVDGGAGPYTYTYTWYLKDASGNPLTWSGGASTKTGKTITVNADEVPVLSNVMCDVSS